MLNIFLNKTQASSSSKQEFFPPNFSPELAVPPLIFCLNISKQNGPVFFFFLSSFLLYFLPFFLTYLLHRRVSFLST